MTYLTFFNQSGSLFLLIGVIAIIIGITNYHYFFQCDYVQIRTSSNWTVSAGYTVNQFINLVVGTLALPIGIIFLLIFATHSFNNPWHDDNSSNNSASTYKFIQICVYQILFLVFFICTVMSYLISINILSCGIFCMGSDAEVSTKKDGIVISVGVLYFIGSLLFTALFLWLLLLSLKDYEEINKRNKQSNRINNIHDDSRNNGSSSDNSGCSSCIDSTLNACCSSKESQKTIIENENEALSLLNRENDNGSINSNGNNDTSNSSNRIINNSHHSRKPQVPILKTAAYYKQVQQQFILKSKHDKKWYTAILIAVFVILYPFLVFACTALPTWGFWFSKYDIQAYQATTPSVSTYGKYWRWDVGPNTTLKLYPDILIFYLAIYIIVCIALMAEYYPKLRSFLLYRPQLNVPVVVWNMESMYTAAGTTDTNNEIDRYTADDNSNSSDNNTNKIICKSTTNTSTSTSSNSTCTINLFNYACYGEIFLFIFLILLFFGQFFYWYYDHIWENKSYRHRSPAEKIARSIGQVSNTITGLLILPVSRNSVWSSLFGVSWESGIKYHQYLAYAFFITVIMHIICWWVVYDEQGSFPSDIFAVPMSYHTDNMTIPLSVISTIFMFVFIGVLSYETIRRLNYDLFYYAHHFFLVVFLVQLWHATMSWYYITAGLFLWAVDHCLRLYRSIGYRVTVVSLKAITSPQLELAVTGVSGNNSSNTTSSTNNNDDGSVVSTDNTKGGIVELKYTVEIPLTLYDGHFFSLPDHDISDGTTSSSNNNNNSNTNIATPTNTTTVNQGLPHSMGQYCLINIPAIDALAWHPFTISSTPYESQSVVPPVVPLVMPICDSDNDNGNTNVKIADSSSTATILKSSSPQQQSDRQSWQSAQQGVTCHYIKSQGNNEWTARLYNLAVAINNKGSNNNNNNSGIRSSNSSDGDNDNHNNDNNNTSSSLLSLSSLVMNIDGPYGVTLPIHKYRSLLLVAGGIGITPLHCIFRHIYLSHRHKLELQTPTSDTGIVQQQLLLRVRLVWVVKNRVELNIFEESLQEISAYIDQFKAKAAAKSKNITSTLFSFDLYCTSNTNSTNTNTKQQMNSTNNNHSSLFPVQTGRPNLENEVQQLSQSVNNVEVDMGSLESNNSNLNDIDTNNNTDGALLFVCGPTSLVTQCSNLCLQYDVEFKSEVFEL